MDKEPVNRTSEVATLIAIGTVVLIGGAFVLLRPTGPATRRLTLPSGREVEVIRMGLDDPASRLWSFSYRTYLPMNQPGRVACEVTLLWKDLQSQVDATQAQEAIVEPESFSKHLVFAGWRPAIISNVSTGYVFVKRETGEWAQQGGPYCGE